MFLLRIVWRKHNYAIRYIVKPPYKYDLHNNKLSTLSQATLLESTLFFIYVTTHNYK